MFKRVIWMGAGFAGGLGSSFWVKRAVNRKIKRHVPDDVRTAVAGKARSVGSTVTSAVREGRAAMVQYQTEAEAAVREPRTERPRLRAVE